MISRNVTGLVFACILSACGSKVEADYSGKPTENTTHQVQTTSPDSKVTADNRSSTEFSRSGTQVDAQTPISQIDPNAPEPIQNESVESSSAKVSTSKNSTLQVAGKAVIIYFPTTEDMLNTPETEANAGIVEVLSEFEQEAREFEQSTGLNGVQVFWSTDRYVSVQLENGTKKVFERNMVDRLVGVIFTDGKKQPVEEQSLLTAEEYRKRAKKFFAQ
jgi:hypothetical protein